jgi:hypothetical protein
MTSTKKTFRIGLSSFACLCVLVLAVPARADILELVNGDHYSGTVVSLNRTNLEFRSEIQGLVKIPRDKIARITLREPTAVKPATNTTSLSPVTTGSVAAIANPTVPQDQANLIVQQMRQQGVDPNVMKQVQEQILGGSSPEATQMFNQMTSGLMSGSLNIGDIRNQAVKAINDLQAAKKDLGGDASMNELLDGYLTILQNFVHEADSTTTTAQNTSTQPSPPPTASTPANPAK